NAYLYPDARLHARLLDKHATTLQKIPAIYTKIEDDDTAGKRWTKETVWALHDGASYTLMLTMPKKDLPAYEPVFKHVVDAFRFDCKVRKKQERRGISGNQGGVSKQRATTK